MAALQKSAQWGCFNPKECQLKFPEGVTLQHFIDAIDVFIDRHGAGPKIRTQCHHIHFRLWHFLRHVGLPTMLTIGDIVWRDEGRPRFGASYGDLKKEWRGVKAATKDDTNYHVWLTIPHGGVIIDLTLLPYFDGEIPADYSWHDRIYISGCINAGEQIEHIPYLVGVNFLLESGAVILPEQG